MHNLEKRHHYIILYRFYENLLTKKQNEYFEAYFYNNWSIYEIAEAWNVTSSAVYDALRLLQLKLDDYEKKLNLAQKDRKRQEIYQKYEKTCTFIQALRDIDEN